MERKGKILSGATLCIGGAFLVVFTYVLKRPQPLFNYVVGSAGIVVGAFRLLQGLRLTDKKSP